MIFKNTSDKPSPASSNAQPRTTPSTSVTRRPITQFELRDYLDLMAAVRRQKFMRVNLIRRIEAGAAVETGTLSLHLDRQQSRRLSRAHLVAILGTARTDKLVAMVPLTTTLRLTVRNEDEKGTQSTAGLRGL